MVKRQNGPDTGIARVEAAPCHRAQEQRNDFRRRPQLTNADMRADCASQKASHQDRAEDGGGRDGVKDGAGEYDRTHDTGQVHGEPGFLQHARDLCRREKLNSAVCHQSDNDERAHYPAGPQGAMHGHSFRHWQVHSFGHLSFSDGGYQYWELTVSLRYDKRRGNELTVLSAVNNTEARQCRISTPSSFS